MTQNDVPLIDKIKETLADLNESKQITKEDRELAQTEIGINYVTLSTYLNNKPNATNLQTAEKLLAFFQKRIAKREKKIL